MQRRVLAAVAVLLVAACAGGAAWWMHSKGNSADTGRLLLHGNVDIREVSLAFEESGRVARMMRDEGERVAKGDVIAELDTRTLELELAEAEASLRASEQEVLRLHHGNRPQEIAKGRADVRAAEAEARRRAKDLERYETLARAPGGRAVSEQSLDAARSADRVAREKLASARKSLELLEIGPRKEDILAAEAKRDQVKAGIALLRHRISLGKLVAPEDAVVRTRLLEPGDMASSAKPVYRLAITTPKWVRVYVSEKDLGRVKPGAPAEVTTDSDSSRPVPGRVGYISSVAEFTPKTVQTEDLRTSLVYEVRVLVEDGDSRLRLGQPADVRISTDWSGEASSPAAGSVPEPSASSAR
ncbi:MAG: HlyD family efflux transporter periplasmic adaptor subunit [Sutterellaceae bacterium]|nr:HlyD family efflux transporter periplasmic adaptor subunit [Sutterellaceae bacterium]MDY2868409.1 HlyD family efflux transporter periplasmic adaptor subunit [Mesosutterella sp.]